MRIQRGRFMSACRLVCDALGFPVPNGGVRGPVQSRHGERRAGATVALLEYME